MSLPLHRTIRIGIDVHDTFTYRPEFFRHLLATWGAPVYFVTGTPASRRSDVEQLLASHGVPSGAYAGLLMGFEYEKRGMSVEHFRRMREHKRDLIQRAGVTVYFDDNPFYADHLRQHGVLVFQTILDDGYIDAFSRADPYFSCHLQRRQFMFLHDLVDADVLKTEHSATSPSPIRLSGADGRHSSGAVP